MTIMAGRTRHTLITSASCGSPPIHLLSEYEGYENQATIAFADKDSEDKIEILGFVEEPEDWVVRLHIKTSDPDAIDKPQVHRFSVYLNRYDHEDDSIIARDLVVLAELIVLPSAITNLQ